MERQYTTELFDKFTNEKTISTIRYKKFGGWLETHEPNQSVMLYKNDMAMPSLNIKYEVRLFASAVYTSYPNGEEIYIEILNYFHDGHADKSTNNQNFKDTSLDLLFDGETSSIKSVMINDHENRFARSGLVNKDIFTREQLIKFPMNKEQFTKFCDGKNISIRISGITNPIRLGINHEFDLSTCKTLQLICKQLYNESIEYDKYKDLNPITKSTKKTVKKESKKSNPILGILGVILIIATVYYFVVKDDKYEIANTDNSTNQSVPEANPSIQETENYSSNLTKETIDTVVNSVNSDEKIDTYVRYSDVLIEDLKTNSFWYVTPDKGFNFEDAITFAENLHEKNLNWRIPTYDEIKKLYNPNYSAGSGFFKDNKFYPSKIHNVFNSIGSGSWFWVSDINNESSKAYAINLHEGVRTTFDSQNPIYPVHLILISNPK